MDDESEKFLERLVEAGRLQEAADLCRRHVSDRPEGVYWLRQLGFVCFLDDMNDAAYYRDAPRVFRELVQRVPASADAYFWLGYVQTIIEADDRGAEESLTAALRLDPGHPYAQLVLAGLTEGEGAISILRKVLVLQPGNLRAWRTLAQVLEQVGDDEGGRRALRHLVEVSPYIESKYGIMNGYTNMVLTGSVHAERWKQEAQKQLE